ncbi:uncharacterized protein LOC123305956 [Chrysoperla carnea]|uniref:uncharacterized protein LOC123305956 n=1 Tax=Chrysoperla carnea TaxID=189513 RepID=UPI001D08AC88|nr:uncharacterized protein LOC123305956 [Chrysoperla carnea]
MARKPLSSNDILQMLESGNVSDIDLSEDDEEDLIEIADDSLIFNDPALIGRRENFVRVGADVIHNNQTELPEDLIFEESDDESSKENIDTSNKQISTKAAKIKIQWKKAEFQIKKLDAWDNSFECEEVGSPISYFNKYLPAEYFSEIAQYTNMYALQQDKKGFKPCKEQEIQILFALHMMMGCLKFPQITLYYKNLVLWAP